MSLLIVRDLYAGFEDGSYVLKGVNLEVGRGEVHVVMGPNGSGKTTLLNAIMGIKRFAVFRGKIVFEGKDITRLSPFERAKLGIAMMFQKPPKIKGVSLETLLEYMMRKFGTDKEFVESVASQLGIRHLFGRSLHDEFSGGESKKVEILLTMVQRPKLALLDEPDSGVDVDSVRVLAAKINELIDIGSSILLVTHTGQVLKHVKRVDKVHVMIDGRIVLSGEPSEILPKVYEKGFSWVEAEVGAK